MRGKYSPTVSAAYQANQDWWSLYAGTSKEWTEYDPEGYDSYGYNKDGVDRAGNPEYAYYYSDDNDCGNIAYNNALEAWGFDGTKPMQQA